jgi:pseudaminic acid biosynthesis-associated methylase
MTAQTQFWCGDFGKEYTDRNPQNLQEWDRLYLEHYGITRTEMNQEFVGFLDRESRILEVGCNIGNQLLGLQRMSFENLYGIELQAYAVEKAKSTTKNINIIQGSAFDIPFRNGYFDLVYTAGVLIHIAPTDLHQVMAEMVRCTKRYIWGFEYYSSEPKEINYRGNKGVLWKMDYAEEFMRLDKRLSLLKKKRYPDVAEQEKGNEDAMYLLEIK